jgi:hypothetical protein
MRFQLLVVVAVALLASTVFGLTDDEISKFKTSGKCLPSVMSTGYSSTLCGTVSITISGSNLVVASNSIPDHDILKDYKYRDVFRGFCITIAVQSFSMTIPKTRTPIQLHEPDELHTLLRL